MGDSYMVGAPRAASETKESASDGKKPKKPKDKEKNHKKDNTAEKEGKLEEVEKRERGSEDSGSAPVAKELLLDDEESDDEDDGKVEEEEVVPAEEQRTLAAKERQRRGTVSLFEMVVADSGGNAVRREDTISRKSESDDEGGSGRKTNEIVRARTESDEEKDDDHRPLRSKGSNSKANDAPLKDIKDKSSSDKEHSPKVQKDRDRKKDKELQKERKERERKEREERDREERERKEKEKKEKLKEKERKREEKEKKKKEKRDKSKILRDSNTIPRSADVADDSVGAKTAEPIPTASNPDPSEERKSIDSDEAVHVDTSPNDEKQHAAYELGEDHLAPNSPQSRYKEMMSQKYASVSSDPAGYRTHMTMNYFAKLAEQRRIKRNREEAFRLIRELNQKDYQSLKKTHERLLKEAQEARRRRVREGGPLHAASPKNVPARVHSDLGTSELEKEEDEKGEERSDSISGEEKGEKSRRHKFNKKSRTMPDMERKYRKDALAFGTDQQDNLERSGSSEHPDSSTGLQDEPTDKNQQESGSSPESTKPKDDVGEEKPASLRSSHSSPKSPLNPRSKKINAVNKEAGAFDVEAFLDELYETCAEEEAADDDVAKYLYIKRLLRDHELHKQERERRLKLTLGLQTPDNGSQLWKESDFIFHKPLTSFVCHRDFARLVRKYQIERPAGEILCGPFDKSQITKVDATYTVLATLAMALDDEAMADHIQTHFKLGHYFQNDDDLTDPTGLEKFFAEVVGENTALMRILKVTSQSIVAPCITKLKSCLEPLDFNSVRNSWSISIAIDSDEITIVHTKQETATPDSEEKFGPFTFEWAIEYVFDIEMVTLKHLRPMLMNVRGSKKSRKLIKKAYVQLVSPKIK